MPTEGQYGFDAGVLNSIKEQFETVSGDLTATVNGILDVKERTSGVWESDSLNTNRLEIDNFAEDANALSLCVQKFKEWVELVESTYTSTDTQNSELWSGYSAGV